jgi:PilZ domain
MSPERRIYGRRVLYSPEYLDMGADNGGVVVNLSEGGLGFQAVGRVEPDSQVPLSFSLGPGYRIDVKARVVWVSAEGKFGGVVFGKLSKDARSLIREWLLKPEVEHDVEAAVSAPEDRTEKHLLERAPQLISTQTPAMPEQESQPNLQSEASPEQSFPVQLGGAPAQNGVVLPPENGQTPVQAARATSFPADATAQPAMPSVNAAVPEPPAPEPERMHSNQNPAVPAPTEAAHNVTPLAPAPEPHDIPVTPIRPQAVAPPPTRGVEHKRERQTGASFPAVPSLSAWSRKDAPAGPGTAASPTAAAGVFPLRNAENIFARSTPLQVEPQPDVRKGSATLLIISIVIAAGAVLAFYVRTHRQQVGDAIVHIGNSVAGAPAAASAAAPPTTQPANTNPVGTPSAAGSTTATPATAPPAVVAQAPAAAAGTPGQLTKPGRSSPLPPGASVNGQAAQSASKAAPSSAIAPAPPYSGQAEYQRAEKYLNGKGVAQDPAEAAEWFWRSLEAGNTDAAVPLADLYLQGNGVSRSCTQAHILLDTAARKGNSEAIKKLAQLPENCQ